MDREVAELERRLVASPEDADLLRAAVRAHERSGSRARAVALIERLRERAEDPELYQRRRHLLSQGQLAEARQPRRIVAGERQVLALAIDAEEARLASGHLGGGVRVWSLAPGREGERLFAVDAHRKSTSAVAFSPGGSLVTGGRDGRARVWDMEARRATRMLGRTSGSRPFSVSLWAGILEAQWRGDGHRRAAGAAETEAYPALFPNLHLPELDLPARLVVEDTIWARLQALWPELASRKLDRKPSGLWGGYVPFGDPSFAVVTDALRTAVGVVFPGGLELMDLGARPLGATRDPRLGPVRSYEADQAPALAVAPLGRAALLGSPSAAPRQPDGGPPDRRGGTGALLVIPGAAPHLEALLSDVVVTAVAVAPAGGMAALGTRDGEVWVLPLFPGRQVEPRHGPAAREVLAVAGRGSLVEPLEPTPPGLEDFTLLRRVTPEEVPVPAKYLRVERDRIWLYPARSAAGPGPPEARPLFDAVQIYDLARGGFGTYPFVIHADGRPYRHEVRSRWIVLREVVHHPAPPDEAGPGLPPSPEKAGRIRGKKAVDEALGVATREWVPEPGGRFYAVRAAKRPRDVWLVDPARPEAARHLRTEDATVRLAFSPGGTRLVALGRRGGLEIYGVPPAESASPR